MTRSSDVLRRSSMDKVRRRNDTAEPWEMNPDAPEVALPADAATSLNTLWNRTASPVGIDIPREELRRVAAAVSSGARAVNMLPERLLIVLKDSWAAHPALGAREDRQAMQRVLTEVVSLCICEFYHDPKAR